MNEEEAREFVREFETLGEDLENEPGTGSYVLTGGRELSEAEIYAEAAAQAPELPREAIRMTEDAIIAIGHRIDGGTKTREAVEVQYPQLRGRLWFQHGSLLFMEPDTPANRAKAAPAMEGIECGCVTDTQSCPACRAAAFAGHTTPDHAALMDFAERVTEMMRCRYGRLGVPGQRPACPPVALQVAQTRVAEWLADRLPRETLQEAAGLAYGQYADRLMQSEGTDVRTDWTRQHGGRP